MRHENRASQEGAPTEGLRVKGRLKSIGTSGQLALGKEFAGKTVMVEQLEPGVWIVRLGSFTPDNERWLLNPEVQAALSRAEDHAASHEPKEVGLEQLEAQVLGRSRRSSKRRR